MKNNGIVRIIWGYLAKKRQQLYQTLQSIRIDKPVSMQKSKSEWSISSVSSVISMILGAYSLVAAFFYFFAWNSLKINLNSYNLLDYINYLDFATLAFKSKMNVIILLFGFTLYIAGLLVILPQFLKDENKKSYGKFHRFALVGLYLAIILILFAVFDKSVKLIMFLYIAILILFIVVPFILVLIKDCEKSFSRWAENILFNVYPSSVVATCIITTLLLPLYYLTFFNYSTKINFFELCFYGLFYLFILMNYWMSHQLSISNNSSVQKITLWISLPIISVAIPTLIFIKQIPNSLVFANAGDNPRNIALVEVQSKSGFYGQRLEMAGFKRLSTNESNNLVLAGNTLMSCIESNSLAIITTQLEATTFCKSKNNRNMLQEIAYRRGDIINYDVLENSNICKEKFESYHFKSSNSYGQYLWAQKVFVEQHIGDDYIYLIFGAHIPLHLRNKTIVITPVMTDEKTFTPELIKFDSENDLKGFEILDSFNYGNTCEDLNIETGRNIQNIKRIKNLLFAESDME